MLTSNPSAGTSRWRTLAAAPHRILFLAGASQLMLVMVLWFGVLAARAGLLPFAPLTLPPVWAHAFLALFGLFPFFVFGFLFTTYPRWLGGAPIAAQRYVMVTALLAGGTLLYYLGLFASRALAIAAVLVFLAGWLLALTTLVKIYRASPRQGPHERTLNLALMAGAAGIAVYTAALILDSASAYAAARAIGIWLFLGLTLFAVSHRMIPFFSEAQLRATVAVVNAPGKLANYPLVSPAWSLPLASACLAGHALLEWAGAARWLFVFDLPLAIVALQHTLRWDFRRSLTVRLLGMLHIAFAWFGLAMLLYGTRSLLLAAGFDVIPERAALHAFGLGFVTGMVVAMVSRVTLGHSGRELWADNLTWYCFLGINVTAATRVAAEFIPAAGQWLNLLAAAAWLVFLGAWVAHYAPLYLKPRTDGRPG